MNTRRPSALIADDEPLLRTSLTRLLAQAWPELAVVVEARNGREAVEQFELLQPDICFLDVHMPGLSGIDAASLIGRRAHIVFVTAFNDYAVNVYEQGAIDYLVKPVEPERLADTVARLQQRLRGAQPAHDSDAPLAQIGAHLNQGEAPQALRWIRAGVDPSLRVIPVEAIEFFRADEKSTLIAWRDDAGKAAEALIRAPLKALLPQLDAHQFVHVHRAVVINLRAIDRVVGGENETAEIHLKLRNEVPHVSRSYLHLVKQM